MDEVSKRTSALPRLSRLPQPRPTSGIPKPTSALPRPASVLRPAPSRENLGGVTASTPNSKGELRNPKIRHSISSNQLRSGISAGGELRNPRLRPSASRDQLGSGNVRTSFVGGPKAQAPGNRFHAHRTPSTPLRPTKTLIEESTTPPYDPPAELTAPTEPDDLLFERQLTLTRRPSEGFVSIPSLGSNSSLENVVEAWPSTRYEDDSLQDKFVARPRKPRLSLSERTMETLAQIPSSPALSKKSSTFFDQNRPRSRADSGNSRPGSSNNSDGSGRPRSRPSSRPSSSSGQGDLGFANFRASTSTYKPPLTPINDTPHKRAAGSDLTKTPKSRMPTSRAGLASTPRLPSAKPSLSDLRSPSPARRNYGMQAPKSGSKTLAARPTKPRTPAKNLFKKPSLPALDKSGVESASSRNPSNTSSWDGTIASAPSSRTSVSMNESNEQSSTPPSSRKSSTALREQIAKAKAAKRAQMRLASGGHAPDMKSPIIPSDDGFDFGVNHQDPFNSNRGVNPSKKVLDLRVRAARTSGRLNIAALELKEIPIEVMKMYDLESIGTYDGSWAESVDLTRFVAADNELEQLDDFIFPDTSPDSFDEAQATQGNIFGGLETIDLHGNLLVNVPLGLRRLPCLTSLNLVCPNDHLLLIQY